MSSFGRSLSPAQIQFLRIGPKAGNSIEIRKQVADAITKEKNKELMGETAANSSLNRIPKLTYGEFEKTVSNFGVLINKNFGNETSIHQTQKFGKMAQTINDIMLQEKDKPIFNEKKNALLKKIKDRSDNRTSIKTVYDHMGTKIHITLKSFSLESERSNEGGLPIPYLRFLVAHVNSARLSKIVENALKAEGNQIVVEFDKIESRASHFSNNEAKYQNQPYEIERLGQILKLNLPYIEFHEPDSDYHQKSYILNKELMEIIESNFDNVADIAEKYLDTIALKSAQEGNHEDPQVNRNRRISREEQEHESINQGEDEEEEEEGIKGGLYADNE